MTTSETAHGVVPHRSVIGYLVALGVGYVVFTVGLAAALYVSNFSIVAEHFGEVLLFVGIVAGGMFCLTAILALIPIFLLSRLLKGRSPGWLVCVAAGAGLGVLFAFLYLAAFDALMLQDGPYVVPLLIASIAGAVAGGTFRSIAVGRRGAV